MSAYLSLTKPRLVLMVLVTVAVGYLLGAGAGHNRRRWPSTLLGTALVAGGAGALNQWLERDRDALMRRTAGRALPGGRLTSVEAVSFGLVLGVLGTLLLALGANTLAATVAVVTFLLYVLRLHAAEAADDLNTAVGAIPGALPPLIGWGAATGRLGIEAWSLFLIVFLWQFPHFLAIAWIYREDYRRAGFRMLTARDDRGPDDRLPGGLVRPGPDPGRPAAGDDRPGRAVLLRRRRWCWAWSIWWRPLGSGARPATWAPAGCCVPRSSTCPRSCCCCCSIRPPEPADELRPSRGAAAFRNPLVLVP